jgi:collagenase-like PrtC family protease
LLPGYSPLIPALLIEQLQARRRAMTKLSTRLFSEKYAEPCIALALICSTNSLVELRAAVDNGADWVKLNIQTDRIGCSAWESGGMRKGIRYAHDRQCKVLVSLPNSRLQPSWRICREIVNSAAQSEVDGFVFSDPALMLYAAAHFPEVQLHYALEDTPLNCNTIDFCRRQLGATGLLLSRSLSLSSLEQLGDIKELCLAVFGYSTLTAAPSRRDERVTSHGDVQSMHAGHRPNLGMTMHAAAVSGELGPCAVDESSANDCRYNAGETFDLNVLRFLPTLSRSGVRGIVAEAPPHAPMHLGQVTRVWREAIDDCLDDVEHYCVKQTWLAKLDEQSKGMSSSNMIAPP